MIWSCCVRQNGSRQDQYSSKRSPCSHLDAACGGPRSRRHGIRGRQRLLGVCRQDVLRCARIGGRREPGSSHRAVRRGGDLAQISRGRASRFPRRQLSQTTFGIIWLVPAMDGSVQWAGLRTAPLSRSAGAGGRRRASDPRQRARTIAALAQSPAEGIPPRISTGSTRSSTRRPSSPSQ